MGGQGIQGWVDDHGRESGAFVRVVVCAAAFFACWWVVVERICGCGGRDGRVAVVTGCPGRGRGLVCPLPGTAATAVIESIVCWETAYMCQ